MPNSNPPIQRASRICDTKAIAALMTRMRKAAPASRRTSDESLPSANSAHAFATGAANREPRHATPDHVRQSERGAPEPTDATKTLCAAPCGT